MVGWLLMLVAFAGSAAAIPVLFVRWFEPRGNFLTLFSNVEGLTFYPSAFDASSVMAVLVVLLAVTTMAAVVTIARGVFVAWTVGAGAAIAGALLCVIIRESPPSPGAGVYTPPELALQPTSAGLLGMGALLLSAASLMVWALGAKRRL